MKKFYSAVEAHYFTSDLYETITERLKELKGEASQITREDLSKVDEFHVRGAAISKELAAAAGIHKAKVLDVGCGLGGPARMLAEECSCEVTGIDISEEFIRTAQCLSELVGLKDCTTFMQADATKLPFKDNSYDAVWTQHVQMNIRNKKNFYSEINRVLKPGGTFIYYDIFKRNNTEITFPVPWASKPAISFLSPISKMENILNTLGLVKEKQTDETQNGIVFFNNLLEKINTQGTPKLGLNVLMGSTTKVKITNLLNALIEDKIELKSGMHSKP